MDQRIDYSKLSEKPSFFQIFFEKGNVPYSITDKTFQFLKVNSKMCHLLGYTESELTALTWVDITHPDDISMDKQKVNGLLAGKFDEYEISKRVICKNGNYIYILLSCSAYRNEEGQCEYILSSYQDITKQKEVEKNLIEMNKEQKILNDLYKNASKSTDINVVLHTIESDLKKFLQADSIGVFLYDNKKNKLQLYSQIGLNEDFYRTSRELYTEDFSTWKAFSTKEYVPFLLIEEEKETPYIELLKHEKIVLRGSFPIVYNNDSLGVLSIGFKEEKEISEKTQAFIQLICNNLSVLLKNVILFNQVKKELEEKIFLEEEIRKEKTALEIVMNEALEERKRSRFILENIDALIWQADAYSTITFFKGRAIEKLGLQEYDVIGKNLFEVFGNEPSIAIAIRTTLLGKNSKFEFSNNNYYFEVICNPTFSHDQKLIGIVGIMFDVTHKRKIEKNFLKAMKQLEEFSITDELTGIYNRRYIMEQIQQHVNRQIPFSLVICDIDYFKRINDKYGHDCGDYVLKDTVSKMVHFCRKGDVVARWGGEEFLILLPNTNSSAAEIVANRIRENIEKNVVIYDSQKINVTVTFGISSFTENEIIDEVIKNADYALLKGKNAGKNRVIVNN